MTSEKPAAVAASAWRDELRVAVALGLLAGLIEGAGLLAAQEARRSHWPIAFSCGPEILWVAPLVDAVLFGVVALLGALAMRVLRWRERLPVVAAGAVALLAWDVGRITNELSRGVAAAIALPIGAALWFLTRRRARGWARIGRIALPVALVVVALIGGQQWVAARFHAAPGATPPAGAPDVLLVVLDTARSDHLSAYGYARPTTPRLAALAAEGVRFDGCFSTSSWTLPAHASLLTGRLPYEHGALLGPLDGALPVLPELLAARGWRTGAVSANLCFFHRGFGFARGFERFDDFGWSWTSRLASTLLGREVLIRVNPRVGSVVLRKPAAAVVDGCLAWLDREPERPAFTVLNFFDAHDPYHPPATTAGRFKGDGIAPAPMPALEAGETRPWDDALVADEARRYDECLLAIDQELGRLFDELARRGRLDRTIVIVTGDHGESFGERGARLHRGSLQREQLQVPLIVRAPGRAQAGGRAGGTVALPVSLASLPATIVELLGLDDATFPGPSLAPLLRDGDAFDAEPLVIAELARHPWAEYRRRPCFDGSLRSLLRGRWHYVRHESHGGQLFDWRADPREERDLAATQPDVAAAFEQALRDAMAGLVAHPNALDASDLSSRPELAGIGYAAGGGP
jgi:arylsulfatase A-like enzyme